MQVVRGKLINLLLQEGLLILGETLGVSLVEFTILRSLEPCLSISLIFLIIIFDILLGMGG
jgi:hypothetical protein